MIRIRLAKVPFLGSKFMCTLHPFLAVFAKNHHRNGRYVSATVIKVIVAQEINGQAFIVGGSGIWWMRNWSHQNSVKLDAERWTLNTIDSHRFLLFGEMETGLPKFEAPPFS